MTQRGLLPIIAIFGIAWVIILLEVSLQYRQEKEMQRQEIEQIVKK